MVCCGSSKNRRNEAETTRKELSPATGGEAPRLSTSASYTLKEDPQPQVLFTFGFSNLKPAPSSVST